MELAQDPFGNYIVHHYLENSTDQEKISELAELVRPKIMQLSLQKFSSNVVDIFLKKKQVAVLAPGLDVRACKEMIVN